MKRKKTAIKAAVKANSAKKQKPNIKPDDYKSIKSIQQKYDKPIQKPKKEREKIKAELKSLRQPIYSLKRKLNKETRKTYADKIRREIRKQEKSISKPVDTLIQKRKDVKYIEKKFEAIRKEKTQKRNVLKKFDRLIDKAEENKDYKEVERLTFQKIKELGNIDELNSMLGMPVPKQNISDYESKETKDKQGFLEDVTNPLTIWEAIDKLREDRKSGEWDFIILEGEKISTKDMILLASASSSFWSILKQTKTRTPHVLRYFNLAKKTVKYESYK